MKSFLLNLSNKQKVIILCLVAIIFIIIFIFVYKYYYGDSSSLESLNEIEANNIANNAGFDYSSDFDYNTNSSVEGNDTSSSNVAGNVSLSNNSSKDSAKSKFGVVTKDKMITVHVIGEVVSPGVVSLKEGSRIIDAINSCGGKTENADITKINLAYILEDGIQIYVPRLDDDIDNVEYIREGAGENVISENVVQDDKKSIKVNINTANLDKLQTLPGIGEAMAKRIIEYRTENGKFQSIEDIKNVSGIGDSKFEKIKEYIVIK